MTSKIIRQVHFIEDSADEIFLAKIFLERDNIDIDLLHHFDLNDFQNHMNENLDNPPELLLVDLNLPGIKGTKIIEQLYANPKMRNIIAGVCTGSDDPQDRKDCFNAGAHFFVRKPLNLECLRAICLSKPELSVEVQNNGSNVLRRTSS